VCVCICVCVCERECVSEKAGECSIDAAIIIALYVRACVCV